MQAAELVDERACGETPGVCMLGEEEGGVLGKDSERVLIVS